ncbi:glycosyltransferase family 8 protein [Leptolyngbya sp. KIOST-1]|uniref:glycosyltransferase family 8 protein n=1 Tax=Leptolyngbya sp. KIOST-1 TaxID=1229172 RepID=UPI0018CD43DF|nr:glycosyltransferase family 8 protein [Leptolyngbya sp. KIOST-1]
MDFRIKEPIVVACAADDFFAIPLAVTSFSALKNLSPDRQMILYILDGGISSGNKRKLLETLDSDRLEVHWVKPTEDQIRKTIYKCRGSNHPISNYYRLLLPAIVPSQFNKLIYLDSDVVVEGDLAELWDQDIEDQYLLAVADPVHKTILSAEHLNPYDLDKKGLTEEHKYLNAGVLVINLEKWREAKIADLVLEFIGNHPDLPFPDQDAINVILAGKWREISPLWNQMHVVHFFATPEHNPYDEKLYADLIRKPNIIHYTTRPKPWNKNCIHPQADRYFKYLDQTAWKGWRISDLSYNLDLARRSIRRVRTLISKTLLSRQF